MKKQFLYIISSVFFSVILFIYATSNNFQNSTTARQTTSETYTNTIANVPIDIKYNSDEYFISGFASEVSVDLSGSNRVILNSEMQESTRSFRVTADLSKVESGTVEVPLKVENLSSGLIATVKPSKITVTIGKKTRKDFSVKSVIDTSTQLEKGVEIDSVSLSQDTVTVTSDKDTIDKIDHVEAVLPEGEIISGNFSGKVPLRAVDSSGEVLASVVSPSEITMKVTVKKSNSNSSSSSTSSSTSE